jgi:integrase
MEKETAMASVTTIRDGKRPVKAIDFVDNSDNRKRKRIRLGAASNKFAQQCKTWIERLIAAKAANHPDLQALEWANGLADDLHERIAKQGLLPPRQPEPVAPTLGGFLSKHIEQRTPDLAPSSIKRLRDTQGELERFFDAETTLDAITADMTHDWRASLRSRLTEAGTRLHCRNAKSMAKAAVKRGLIAENSFVDLVSSSVAANRERYVSREEAIAILDECPNQQWRLLFVLCRFAGLRCPSETHALTWGDIDWGRRRMTIRDKKRKRLRVIPIFAEVASHLEAAFDAAPEGEERVVTLSKNNRYRTLHAIVARAGVDPWDDLFQALRQAAETDLAKRFPQHAVSAWIGHSMQVSERHYLQLTDDLYEAAAETSADSAAVAVGN